MYCENVKSIFKVCSLLSGQCLVLLQQRPVNDYNCYPTKPLLIMATTQLIMMSNVYTKINLHGLSLEKHPVSEFEL